MIKKHLNSIIDTYGINHKISSLSILKLSKFIKESEQSNEVLSKSIDINIDELESLFNPDKFDFERKKINKVEVDLE